jgi:phosphomannomutase
MVDPERLARVVKAYDIRGLVDEDLDEPTVQALGAASAEVLAAPGGSLVLGRDMRPSSPRLAAAFVEGVRSQGVEVVDIGLASTDQLYFASGMLDVPGAMVTASHNPAGHNGLKLCRAGAAPVAIDSGLALIGELAARGGLSPAGVRGGYRSLDVGDDYAHHVRGFVDESRLHGVRVAVDAGNGMAGLVWPLVAEPIGIETRALYFELDGTFPNHPADPLDEANLADLRREVASGGYTLGLAFDGDGDRVFVVDERGEPLTASIVGAIVADHLLERHPGQTVLYSLICSDVVPESIAAAGGRAVRTRVGHSFVKQRMAQTDALLAVEHSGHYYFRDHFRADSGTIAALLLLEAVVTRAQPLSTLASAYDRYHRSGERNFVVDDPDAVLARVARAFADRGTLDREDGLTVRWEAGWFNLRPSNTEARLRLNVETHDPGACDAVVDEVAELVGRREER